MPLSSIETAKAVSVSYACLPAVIIYDVRTRGGGYHIPPVISRYAGCRTANTWSKQSLAFQRCHAEGIAGAGFQRGMLHIYQRSTRGGLRIGKECLKWHIDKVRVAIVLVTIR